MNNEYALVKLLLKDAHQAVDFYGKGLRQKHFRIKKYGLLYNAIYLCKSTYNSVPTVDQIASCGVEIDNEEVPYTAEHLLSEIEKDYNLRHYQKSLKNSVEFLKESNLEELEKVILQAPQEKAKFTKTERSQDITHCIDSFWEDYLFREQYKGQITGVPTGFNQIDELTMGLQPQWLVTISGRNAQFKTMVVLAWALHAWRSGYNVYLFSCEMSIKELQIRIFGLGSNIEPDKIKRANLDDDEKTSLKKFLEDSKSASFGKLFLDDDPNNMMEISNRILEKKKFVDLNMIMIDSAYRLNSSGDSDVARQTSIARSAKDLAKRENIPVVCSVQLNREFAKANDGEKTKDKTKSGGHFVYGTDAWNQDSDLLFSINRPEDYEAFHYSDFITDKFRHGNEPDFILEINLNVPKVAQIDATIAKRHMNGGSIMPQTIAKGNNILEAANDIIKKLNLQNNTQEENLDDTSNDKET